MFRRLCYTCDSPEHLAAKCPCNQKKQEDKTARPNDGKLTTGKLSPGAKQEKRSGRELPSMSMEGRAPKMATLDRRPLREKEENICLYGEHSRKDSPEQQGTETDFDDDDDDDLPLLRRSAR